MRRKKLPTPTQQPNGAPPPLTPHPAPPIGMVKPLAEEPPSWLFVGFMGIGTGLLLVSCIVLIGVGYWILNGREGDSDKEAEIGTPSTPPTATIFVVGDPPVNEPTNTATIEISSTPTSTSTIPPTSTSAGPTLTFTFVPPTRLPATNTTTATRTLLPTNTLEPTLPPTIGPTATTGFTPFPTNTLEAPLNNNSQQTGSSSSPTATRTLAPATLLPTLTATIATGQRIRLFYDGASFYLWNPTRNRILVENIAFEAIDSTGLSTGYRFEGSRWAEFYEYVEPNNCASIEITTGPTWLRPRQCVVYNAEVTPQDSAPFIFWVSRSGVTQFRVLWNEQEIGRCTIGAGQCDVFLP